MEAIEYPTRKLHPGDSLKSYLQEQGFKVNLFGGFNMPFQIDANHRSGLSIYFVHWNDRGIVTLKIFDEPRLFHASSKTASILSEQRIVIGKDYPSGTWMDFYDLFYLFWLMWQDVKYLVEE